MSDISNQLISGSYNYVLQSDLATGNVYRIGGSIPVDPKFLSGLTIFTSFKFSDGSEQNGYVLTSDALGNASWQISSNDVRVTGFSYTPNTFTIFDNSGNTFSTTINDVTGLTINGNLTITGNTSIYGLSAVTISATTYENLPIDIRVTGGTYSNGTAIFTNNTGGTFNVSGFYTGGTDVYVTGGTYSSGTATFTNNTGGTFNVTGFYTGSTDVFVTGVLITMIIH